jgi:hypothetical protein
MPAISKTTKALLVCWIALASPMAISAEAPPTLRGVWTVLSKPQPLSHTYWPSDVAIDREGQLYVADSEDRGRIPLGSALKLAVNSPGVNFSFKG